MPEFSPNPDFLKEKYQSVQNPDGTRGLHNAPEVQRSANFVSQEEGTKLNSPAEKIDAYLGRLEGFFNDPDPKKRERKIHFLKTKLFDLLITKPEDVPASYDKFIIQTLEEQGQRGDWDNASDEQKQELRQQNIEGQISDQKESLEMWIDYLGSEDAIYPSWLKYWAFRSISNMQEYEKPERDKETGREIRKGRFPQRSNGTLKMFPDLNYEALSYVLDTVSQKYQGKSPEFPYDIQEDEKARFMQFLNNENFASLYGWAIENVNPIDEELLKTTDGQWVKYNHNSDPEPLVKSIRGKGTGWCTAGLTTAKRQLELGDFHVFYSNDQENNPAIPRIAIRMQENKIAEVRGIARKQNIDPYIGDVLEKKLEEFPDKAEFLQKKQDMTHLTELKSKSSKGEAFNREDLIFLYEIDHKIQGFGYVADPRIKELRNGRNPKEDAPIVLECTPEEIAWNANEINQNTKSYIGPLSSGIFQYKLEHIYTVFPETEISRGKFETTGKTGSQLKAELENNQVNMFNTGKFMLGSSEFVVSPAGEKISTVRLKVRDLFSDKKSHAYSEILSRANELGLDSLPHETAADLLLSDDEKNKPNLGEWFRVVSKTITDRDGDPSVFSLTRFGVGLWLSNFWADPADEWSPDRELMFRLRQVSQES